MCNLKSALIPQPLLPQGEGEPIQILAPFPKGERGWGVACFPKGGRFEKVAHRLVIQSLMEQGA